MVRHYRLAARSARAGCCPGTKKTPHCVGGLRGGKAGNQRPHQRWLHFTDRKKRPVVANVAIARELAGWCWSLAVMDD